MLFFSATSLPALLVHNMVVNSVLNQLIRENICGCFYCLQIPFSVAWLHAWLGASRLMLCLNTRKLET